MLEYLKMGINVFSKPDGMRSASTPMEKSSRGEKINNFEISLGQLVDQIAPLPTYSIVIGGCEDGMHFYLALDDPRPGSILVVGDRGCGKRRLMESIMASGAMLNPPRHLRYVLISENLIRFNGYTSKAHCYAALEPGMGASKLIYDLTDIFAQRWAGQMTGSPILLMVNDLKHIRDELDERSVEDLIWLIQHGPQAHIWPIVTLHAEDFTEMDQYIIEAFGTHLIGRIQSPDTAHAFTGEGGTFAAELMEGKQFGVLFDEEWLKFWIPEIDEVRR